MKLISNDNATYRERSNCLIYLAVESSKVKHTESYNSVKLLLN